MYIVAFAYYGAGKYGHGIPQQMVTVYKLVGEGRRIIGGREENVLQVKICNL